MIESYLPKGFQNYLLKARLCLRQLKEVNLHFDFQRKIICQNYLGKWIQIVINRNKLRRMFVLLCKWNYILAIDKWRSKVALHFYAIIIQKAFRGYYYGRKVLN